MEYEMTIGVTPGELLVAKAFLASPKIQDRPTSPPTFLTLPKIINDVAKECDSFSFNSFVNQFSDLSNDNRVAFLHWFSLLTIDRQIDFIHQGDQILDVPALKSRCDQERAMRLSCLVNRIENSDNNMFPWEVYNYISRAVPANIRGRIRDQLAFSNSNQITKLCFRLKEGPIEISESEMLHEFNRCFKSIGLSILTKDFMVISTTYLSKDLHIYEDGKKVSPESFDYSDHVAYRCLGRLTNPDNSAAGFFLFTIFPESRVLHEDLVSFKSEVPNAIQTFDPMLRQLCIRMGLEKINLTADHVGRYVHAKRDGIQFYNRNDANRLDRVLESFLDQHNISASDVWIGQRRATSFSNLRRIINKSPIAFTRLKFHVHNQLIPVQVREGYDNDGNLILTNQDLPLSKAFLLANDCDNSWRATIDLLN